MTIPTRFSSPAAEGLDCALAQLDAADFASLERLNVALGALLDIQRLGGEQGCIALDALKQIGDV